MSDLPSRVAQVVRSGRLSKATTRFYVYVPGSPIFACGKPLPVSAPPSSQRLISLDTATGKIVSGRRFPGQSGTLVPTKLPQPLSPSVSIPCSLFPVPRSLDALIRRLSIHTLQAAAARCAPARGRQTAAPFRRNQRAGCRRPECRERWWRRLRRPESCCADECG